MRTTVWTARQTQHSGINSYGTGGDDQPLGATLLPFDATNNNAFAAAPGAYLIKSIAASIYHGLQVNVTQQISHGLQIQGAYTWSHSIDNSSDPLDPASGNRGLPRNSFNLQAERGNSDFDVRQRLSLNLSSQPNIGRGRAHLNNGFAGRFIEGWEISGITSFRLVTL